MTWDEHYRAPFAPLLSGVTFVAAQDTAAVAAAITQHTAAVIVEPIQGEGGVRPLSRETADAIAKACEATGALLIADEVQSGLGRTGRPFYSATLGLKPDLMALGKALGAGVPIGAALMSERVAAAIQPGDHGSTYGGNPLACRAALVFIDQLVDGGRDAERRPDGCAPRSRIARAGGPTPAVIDVRGAGLMWGVELDRPAAPVVQAALERKLLINRTSDTVIRLLPPFVITEREIDEALPLLEAAIEAATEALRRHEHSTPNRDGRRWRRHPSPHCRQRRRRGTCCRGRSKTSRRTPPDSSSRSTTGVVIGCAELAPLSEDVAEVRSLVVDEARRGQRTRGRAGDSARGRRADARVRHAVRVHASAVALSAPGLLDRAARLAAREDRARLRRVRAVPAVRSVCRLAAAAGRQLSSPQRAIGSGSRGGAARSSVERLRLTPVEADAESVSA